MLSWLEIRRDVAIDAVVAYVSPRLTLGMAIVIVLLLAVMPPVATAGRVGLIWLAFWWTQEKKPNVPSLEFRNFSGDGGAVMAGVGGAASGGLGS